MIDSAAAFLGAVRAVPRVRWPRERVMSAELAGLIAAAVMAVYCVRVGLTSLRGQRRGPFV